MMQEIDFQQAQAEPLPKDSSLSPENTK